MSNGSQTTKHPTIEEINIEAKKVVEMQWKKPKTTPEGYELKLVPKRLPSIARCDKCGREFVELRSDIPTDRYPDRRHWREDQTPCGGIIVPIEGSAA